MNLPSPSQLPKNFPLDIPLKLKLHVRFVPTLICNKRARKSRRTLQNKVRLKVLPEQLTLFVNTFVALKKCISQ